jgi:hypothetical protein
MQPSYNPLNQPVNSRELAADTQMRGANGQRLVKPSPRSGRLSFYIWRRGAAQKILAGGEGRRSCGPQPPEPAIPLTAPRQARIRAGPRRIALAAPSRAAVAAHFPFAFIRGFGLLTPRPSPPAIILGTAPRCQRPKAAPNVETPEPAKRATENAARFLSPASRACSACCGRFPSRRAGPWAFFFRPLRGLHAAGKAAVDQFCSCSL